MTSYLFRGILIGLLFGLPVGAVGTMTVQRAWSFGFRAGLLTGLGSSVADCFYAVVGAFGLTLVSDFLLRYQTFINLLGGVLISLMGIRLFVKKDEIALPQTKAISGVKMFLSSFAIGITNPAAILTFLFAFSYFGISDAAEPREGIGLVCGVFIGTYLWWGYADRRDPRRQAESGKPRLSPHEPGVWDGFDVVCILYFCKNIMIDRRNFYEQEYFRSLHQPAQGRQLRNIGR